MLLLTNWIHLLFLLIILTYMRFTPLNTCVCTCVCVCRTIMSKVRTVMTTELSETRLQVSLTATRWASSECFSLFKTIVFFSSTAQQDSESSVQPTKQRQAPVRKRSAFAHGVKDQSTNWVTPESRTKICLVTLKSWNWPRTESFINLRTDS